MAPFTPHLHITFFQGGKKGEAVGRRINVTFRQFRSDDASTSQHIVKGVFICAKWNMEDGGNLIDLFYELDFVFLVFNDDVSMTK